MNFAEIVIRQNEESRVMALTLRIFLLAAGMALAVGGFLIGASSYELDRLVVRNGTANFLPPPLLQPL